LQQKHTLDVTHKQIHITDEHKQLKPIKPMLQTSACLALQLVTSKKNSLATGDFSNFITDSTGLQGII
jgi:hypothetical protein